MSVSTPAEKTRKKFNVVLYWHMHQPEYRDLRDGRYLQPWTYLHVIKDYVDMVAHLEAHPQAKAVVNFAPILLEQIADYRKQLKFYLTDGGGLTDPLLAALADPVLTHNREYNLSLIRDCLRANEDRMIGRFAEYKHLAATAKQILEMPETYCYFSDQFMFDLLVWYHLAWIGETVRRSDQRVISLMKKARKFSIHDRRTLVELIFELTNSVIDRYGKLAKSGQIELSMTPYSHPILPLLQDLQSAKQAMPDAPMPQHEAYPGGEERSLWQLKRGMQVFTESFGLKPKGCWPSEGSVSEDTVRLCSQFGFDWLASGETVMRNSRTLCKMPHDTCIHSAYKVKDSSINCFFRDDSLSDKIGFKYATWKAEDAVANMMETIRSIADACHEYSDPVVSIILDGENAWEYYPENGYYFLDTLYELLSSQDDINLSTYSEILATNPKPQKLPKLVAGSWVYGTFSTWIGSTDKNRAWDMLIDAKKAYDKVKDTDIMTPEEKEKAYLQLAHCESSDWFWWFGDYNPSDSVAAFDEQFRRHLSNLYQLMHVESPEYLAHGFSAGCAQSTHSGTMLPGQND